MSPHTRGSPREVAPGAVHVPAWLAIDEQRQLVEACRRWARPPAPLHPIRTPGGDVTSVQAVCLGWHWSPHRYTRTAVDVDGAPVTPFPGWLGDLGRRALAAAYGDPAAGDGYEPDVAIVSYYDAGARTGLHQDRTERTLDPVVSLSIGDTCTFRFGVPASRRGPHRDLELASGDLFVFGGPSRLAFHGVTRVRPGTGDRATGLGRGRLNITLRVTGLR
jgi:alkylated DNA repair protein (DNA oxidative demethylase)